MSPVKRPKSVCTEVRKVWVSELIGLAYLWNMIHCAAVAMLSWLSLRADSFASTASSLYAILVWVL